MNKNYLNDPRVQAKRWLILTAVGMFTFMATLDASIVNIALPTISKDLAIPMNQAEWIVSVYLMMICALLLFFGKLGDIFGKIRIFRLGTILFIGGSLLSGFNQGLSLLLVGRVIQALGAAMTMSTNNGIITEVFPLNERGKALGWIGSFVSLGSIAGPGIGGLILAKWYWGNIFWINVPVGILTFILGIFVLPADLSKTPARIDWLGTISFAVAILGLFGGIFIGQDIGYSHWAVIGLLLLAVLALIIFFHHERRTPEPMLRLTIFKNIDFSLSLLTALMIFVVNFIFNVIAPFYLQNARGLAANTSGYLLMVFPIIQVLVAPIAGSISDRIGPESLTFWGLVLITVSQIGYFLTDLQSPLWLFTAFVGLVGFGNGLFQAPNNTIVMSSVATKDLGMAGGINGLARELGMVIGITFATTILFSAMSQQLGRHVTTYLPQHPATFIYGMKVTFIISIVLSLVATILTGYRWLKHRRQTV
ncbi:MFS transporter [Lapidilactobacillus luobeiensis]|uniref:MFS transporter n=1 Tax=Lapidilactobacillus luobeiensis TaxID=2950371 RepID=UPI0021C28D00|nr:MFS transporter [Lapidilactobacillus luobeiensis]